MSAKSTEISRSFFEGMKRVSEAHGLNCDYFNLEAVRSVWERKIHIYEGRPEDKPEDKKVHYFLYHRVRAADQNWWGVNIKTLDTLKPLSTKYNCPWGIVLLQPSRGFFLDSEYVAQYRNDWLPDPQGGSNEGKVTSIEDWVTRIFGDPDELFEMLKLSGH